MNTRTKTNDLLSLWEEARTRFSSQIDQLSEESLTKTLGSAPNSIGFLARHIGEVELLFAKNIFGDKSINIVAKTIIDGKDGGKWTDLLSLKAFLDDAFLKLQAIISKQKDEDWNDQITTKEFGTKTKAQALGRVISHTAYHAGQIALINKYGTIKKS